MVCRPGKTQHTLRDVTRCTTALDNTRRTHTYSYTSCEEGRSESRKGDAAPGEAHTHKDTHTHTHTTHPNRSHFPQHTTKRASHSSRPPGALWCVVSVVASPRRGFRRPLISLSVATPWSSRVEHQHNTVLYCDDATGVDFPLLRDVRQVKVKQGWVIVVSVCAHMYAHVRMYVRTYVYV